MCVCVCYAPNYRRFMWRNWLPQVDLKDAYWSSPSCKRARLHLQGSPLTHSPPSPLRRSSWRSRAALRLRAQALRQCSPTLLPATKAGRRARVAARGLRHLARKPESCGLRSLGRLRLVPRLEAARRDSRLASTAVPVALHPRTVDLGQGAVLSRGVSAAAHDIPSRCGRPLEGHELACTGADPGRRRAELGFGFQPERLPGDQRHGHWRGPSDLDAFRRLRAACVRRGRDLRAEDPLSRELNGRRADRSRSKAP